MRTTEMTQKWRHLLMAVLVVAFVLFGGRATSFANQPAASTAAFGGKTEGAGLGSATQSVPPLSRSPSMDETYAQREAAAKDLEPFKGGDLVIIGSGGAVIVLLVILILILA